MYGSTTILLTNCEQKKQINQCSPLYFFWGDNQGNRHVIDLLSTHKNQERITLFKNVVNPKNKKTLNETSEITNCRVTCAPNDPRHDNGTPSTNKLPHRILKVSIAISGERINDKQNRAKDPRIYWRTRLHTKLAIAEWTERNFHQHSDCHRVITGSTPPAAPKAATLAAVLQISSFDTTSADITI